MSDELPSRVSRGEHRRHAGSGSSRQRGDGLRTCLGCGAAYPPDELLRLIAGPDGEIAVDVRRRKGGRGVHLCYRRTCIDTAIRKRRLAKALHVSGTDAGPAVIVEQAARQLQARIDYLLALAQKSGRIASGAQGISCALSSGRVRILVLASDVSVGSREKLEAKPRAMGIPIYALARTREELGHILGKGERAGGALREGPLADALEQDLLRLQTLTGLQPA